MIYINLIIVFIVLVTIHEYGHYIVARYFKAEVTDFSIGFGKPLIKYKDKNGTIWKISPIPLGGYVKIKGLDSIFSKNTKMEKGSFVDAPQKGYESKDGLHFLFPHIIAEKRYL